MYRRAAARLQNSLNGSPDGSLGPGPSLGGMARSPIDVDAMSR